MYVGYCESERGQQNDKGDLLDPQMVISGESSQQIDRKQLAKMAKTKLKKLQQSGGNPGGVSTGQLVSRQ